LPAVAGLAYLNGRHGFTYDWSLLSSFVSAQVASALHERRDDINPFYVLEGHAHSSRADHPWIIFQGKSYTYAQSYQTVLKYGMWLRSKGVQKNEIVAMDFMNSDVFIWVWFGLWSIGAKPAFINYNLAGKPLLHTIRTSTASFVLVDEEGRDKFSDEVMAEHGFFSRPAAERGFEGREASYGFETSPDDIAPALKQHVASRPKAVNGSVQPESRKLEIVIFDKGLVDHISSLEPVRQPDSLRANQKRHDMAMLIYTSGTTGLPKAAVMAWGKASIGAKFVSDWIPLGKNDIMYTAMPLYHSSASVLGVVSILRAGSTICIGKKFSHTTFWPEVRSSQATVIQYVGETCRYLLSAPKTTADKDNNVRCAFGNGMRSDVWEHFKERFNIQTVLEFYAATEAPSAMWNRSSNSFSAGAIGRNGLLTSLLMGSSLSLIKMDPESEPPEPLRDLTTKLCKLAHVDEPGELIFKLDPADIKQKFQGYYGNQDATTSKVIRNVKQKGDAYFRTGDLMRRDKENRWYFVDRIGDTFRWKAENVSTAEVADAMGKHEAVDEAAVYGVQVPRHDGRAGCAAIVLTKSDKAPQDVPLQIPHPQTLKSLAEHAKKNLPAYAIPLFLRVTNGVHTTGTNKQQKHLFQKDGIDVAKVEGHGDALFWLKDSVYERFTSRDLNSIQGGQVKL
jgi:acyl-CoA synthetase (AMP-forming)/AMP-acid ligase II